MIERGKFIVIYGPNNLGKLEQVKLVAERLRDIGKQAEVLKYPIYDLEPTGPKINAALRKGLQLTSEELQREFAQNRRDYEPTLVKMLESGIWAIAEDYKGTGISWGVTYGIPLKVMEDINAGLIDEDMAILLDGERFGAGIEREHLHESGERWGQAREVHLDLAKRYGWEVVNANYSIERVTSEIWQFFEQKLL